MSATGISELREAAFAASAVVFAEEFLGSLDDWQADLLRSEKPRVILNCSRQSGKSTVAAIVALHRALYPPRDAALVLCLAPALRQSQELFAKVLGFYRELGRPVPLRTEQKLSLELANGSRIVSLPGTEKTIRGFSDVDLLIVDEAARVADELYFAIRPMLAVSGGELMLLSTPYGERGVFWEAWTGGVGWERYEVKAEDCPHISPEFLEEERHALPPWVYRQEYECSFEATEDQIFTYALIDSALNEKYEPFVPQGGTRLLGSGG